MRFLKTLAVVVALVAGGHGAAAQPAANGGAGGAAPDFAQHKQRELARIAERIQALQRLQGCVEAATNQAAVQSCNETARAAMKGRAG